MKRRHRKPVFRVNRRVAAYTAVYALVVVAMFGLLRSDFAYGPAVPAMGNSDPKVGSSYPLIDRLFAAVPDLPRSILRTGLPLVAFVEDMESGRRDPESLAAIISKMVAGVNPDEPWTFLESQIPGLALTRTGGKQESTPAADPEQTAEVLIRLPAPSPPTKPPRLITSAEPVVAVYHTHSKESYLPDLADGKPLEPEDAYSNDPAINMTRVGQELVKALQDMGIGAVHSPAVHDKDGKLGAYLRSEATVQALMKQYPSIKVLIDVHRDSQLRARTTTLVRRQLMAKIMVVLGSDNKDWRTNYAFAADFIRVLEERYPGLSAGIFPTAGRFNQHYSPHALLLEFGGVENNIEECLRSARAAAETIAALVKANGLQ